MIVLSGYYKTSSILFKMGSGISITKQQAIQIVRREIERVFNEADSNRRIMDDYGMLLPETFDEEETYIKNLRRLRIMERGLVQN